MARDAQDVMHSAVCERCGCEIYIGGDEYCGMTICHDCVEEMQTVEAVLDYAAKEPGRLLEFLKEFGVMSEEKPVLEVLNMFKEWDWAGFEEWAMS